MPKADDFDMFYAATSRRLVGQIFAMTGDLSEAEDAVQEAYIRAWRRWPRIRAYNDPEAWLRVVAYRITVNSWRKARNRLTAHRASWRSELPGLSPDLVALVSALRKIPEAQRRVIVLHHLAGLSVEEIAHETGAPPGTVKSQLARGRRALAPLVSEFDDNPKPRAGTPPPQPEPPLTPPATPRWARPATYQNTPDREEYPHA
jgi:RNA polymerase sigma-70 factor (ECF subfamily)